MAKARERVLYRGHDIIAQKGRSVARLVGGSSADEGAQKFFEAEAIEDGVAEAKAWVDGKYTERAEGRREPYIGTVDDYVEAFTAQELARHEHTMARAHAAAPDRKLTAQQLADAAGYKSYSSANLHYGKLGQRVAEQAGLSSPKMEAGAWTYALADYDDETNEWRMHEEMAEAMERLNLL